MSERHLAILTYGCQMNKHDSEVMAGLLKQDDYSMTDDLGRADVILINTCSIRDKAEQKVYSQLGTLKQLKKHNPNLVIGVCGCFAQREGWEIIEKAPQVDLVIGSRNIPKIPSMIRKIQEEGIRIAVTDMESAPEFDTYPMIRESSVQAWVSIIQGCNNDCTFCVVPFTRGRERSKPSQSVISEVTQLAEAGYKEITLLGQNVNSYGHDLKEGVDFPDLLALLNEVEGIERIRFITSHPKDLSDKLIAAIRDLPQVCEYLHLPVQAGADRVLAMMDRGYTAQHYLSRIEKMREAVPSIGLSTDIIVGFPGETCEEFCQTLELIEKVQYDSLYMFKYSPRPGTKAATMSEVVPEEEKSRRFEELQTLQREISWKRNQRMEGSIEEVLIEGMSKKDRTRYTGRTRGNKIVNFDGEGGLIGQAVPVEIIKGGIHSLEGKMVTQH
ncbi:MAG: tRNA (N6-isopentenyl adenosine(37)-C2)-methylthiotransferase MiaB [Candidatus Tectomicrobia bacterium]|nr:tRNA (N6-isopentenyl adenosine(37)-C2)-methylthiotransferase MiaB [Candidatus Tectomicrobia bacterium]